ncbi:MAG TPA: hemolysin III family protein [Gaiellaceae bacterium]|nr:hemolysin III family protein [Gaiellaceae bacterium]
MEPAAAVEPKPRLRGVFHEWAFYATIPLGVVFGLAAAGARAQVAAAVFAGGVVAMFGASALYHRFTWPYPTRLWLRRLDHAGIFGLIAATYTPFGLLVLHGTWQKAVLAVAWSGAAIAILTKLAWVAAPKWLSAVGGVALGWVGVLVFPQILQRAGTGTAVLVLAGGICYTAGAVVYARRKPDPSPRVFGYHELFHTLVIAAVALQYAAVALVVSG